MEIENKKKRPRDENEHEVEPEKHPRAVGPPGYDEWHEKFLAYLKEAGLTDVEGEYEMVLADDLKKSALERAEAAKAREAKAKEDKAKEESSKKEGTDAKDGKMEVEPKKEPPKPQPGLYPLSLEENAKLLAGFEEWCFKKDGNLILYEADETTKQETLAITDEELTLLKADKSEILYVPFNIAGSVLRGEEPSTPNNSASKPLMLRFHFLDVGQGNGTLVECPHGELLLIDFGTAKGGTVTTELVVDFVKKKGSKLDYLIVSHADKDHINLLPKLGDIKIGKVICGGKPAHYKKRDGEAFKDFLDDRKIKLSDCLLNKGDLYTELPTSKAKDRKIQCKDVEVFIAIANAPTITTAEVKKLRPESQWGKADEMTVGSETNNASIVVCFRYAGKQVMISADATFSSDYHLLNSTECKGWKGQLKSYALSGGHHGSKKSFSEELLKGVNPEWVHFSADLVDKFKHPNWSLVHRVLTACPLLAERPAYGIHSIVIGEKYDIDDADLANLQLLDDALKSLAKTKKELTKQFAPDDIGWKHTLFWFGLMFLSKFGKAEEAKTEIPYAKSIWAREVISEVARKLFLNPIKVDTSKKQTDKEVTETNRKLLALVETEDMENLNYWAERFESLDTERVRLKENQDDYEDSNWQWFTTEINLYTAMETGDLGVYWVLEIEPDGSTFTFRT